MFFNGDFKQLGQCDINALKSQIESFDESLWDEDKTRQNTYSVHKKTQTINLIFDEDLRHENPTALPKYYQLEEYLIPIESLIKAYYARSLKLKRLASRYGEPYFIRAILVRLAPKSSISKHQDHGESLSRCHRIHIPIQTTEQVQFSVGETTTNIKEGEVWEINNRNIHSVLNQSEHYRIHLIVDYVIPGEKVFDLENVLIA